MERDINLIIDVDADEVGQLIGLINDLVKEWYVARHDRQVRLQAVKNLAAEKENQRRGDGGS